MDKALKVKLVEALRSGKYVQGRGELCKVSGEFCVCGVLCDVSEMGNWVDSKTYRDIKSYRVGEDEYEFGVPEPMINSVITQTEQSGLIRRNDDGDTFPELADYIEQNL